MKKVLAIAVVASSLLFSCFKNLNGTTVTSTCTPISDSAQENSIKAFCIADTVDFDKYVKDTNYVYYHLSDTGTGAAASSSSVIFFTYKATLLNKTLIDQSATPVQSAMVNLIPGFQLMSPFLKKGTHIQMVIPSSLAYGCEGSGQIPSNAPLFYDVTITDVE